MAWTDEIAEAAYTSPGGTRMAFNYSAQVERTTPLKTAENVFPNVDGAEIQSLGLGGRKFPMTAIFSGADCLKDADAFEALLCERGYGQLEHPIYGKHTVVPTGEISRSDDLVGGLNESRVKITFSETLTDGGFPESAVSAEDALSAAIDGYESSAVASFAEIIETGSVDDELQLQGVLKTQSDTLFKGISSLAEKAGSASRELTQKLKNFKTSVNQWIGKVDELAKNAHEIATVLVKTARLPSEIAIGAMAKIEGYSSIIKDIINNVKKDPVGAKAIANQYAATSVVLGALVASMGFGVAKTAAAAGSSVQSAGGTDSGASSASGGGDSGTGTAAASAGGFVSRASVLSAADAVIEQFETYKTYMDAQAATDAFVDTGETYSALLDTVVASVQVMQAAAFELPMARTVRLARDRQVIELLAELYGADGFARLDQFITDNELTADEIVLLPMGREVTYYG